LGAITVLLSYDFRQFVANRKILLYRKPLGPRDRRPGSSSVSLAPLPPGRRPAIEAAIGFGWNPFSPVGYNCLMVKFGPYRIPLLIRRRIS